MEYIPNGTVLRVERVYHNRTLRLQTSQRRPWDGTYVHIDAVSPDLVKSIDPVTTTPEEQKEELRRLMQECGQHGEFRLSSGAVSDYYFDGRMVTLSAEGSLAVGRVINNMIREEEEITHVGGPALGAIPIAMAVSLVGSLEYNRYLHTFILRPGTKKHGLQKDIEAAGLDANSKVIILEDTVTTGDSALNASQKLQMRGSEVARIIALLDREEGASERFANAELSPGTPAPIPFTPIFTKKNLMEDRK